MFKEKLGSIAEFLDLKDMQPDQGIDSPFLGSSSVIDLYQKVFGDEDNQNGFYGQSGAGDQNIFDE